MYTEFVWNLDKIIDGLCASSDIHYRKPSKSRRFPCTTKEKIESVWHLEMRNTNTGLQINLCLSGTATANHFFTNFEITLTSQDNQNCLTWASCKKKEIFSMDYKPDCCINPFMCKNVLQYLHDQKHSFTVVCKMYLQVMGFKVNKVLLSVHDFEDLMHNPEFSDLILVASERQFKVHKNIIAARSKTFSNMIKDIIREKKESIIVIDDFDDEVVQEVIRYIYCGRVENLSKLYKNLLEAAEKYNIEGLKSICLEEFCRKITVDNACKLLLLLDEYKVDDLKSQVLDFIVHHLLDISKSDFTLFKSTNLLREILFKTVAVYAQGN